jgi:hypothetical protein
MTEKKQPKSIHERIHAVMQDLKYIQKGEKKVNGQYAFASHDKVTSEVRKHLVEHGIIVIPSVTNHSQDGNRTVVDIETDFINVDDPNDKVTINFFGYGVDNQDKGPGKAFSYAKKYAFLQLFCLETGDDPEADLIDHKPAEEKTVTAKQTKEIELLIEDVEADRDKFLAWLKVPSCDKIPASKYELVIGKLKEKGSK